MRIIDADDFRKWWLENGENEHIYDTNDILDSIDGWPTLTPQNEQITPTMNNNVSALYELAINTYGPNNQILKAVEELSELQKELCKNLEGAWNRGQIAEEIADVQIMCQQLLIIFSCRGTTAEYRRMKLDRLKHRIEEYQKNEVRNG